MNQGMGGMSGSTLAEPPVINTFFYYLWAYISGGIPHILHVSLCEVIGSISVLFYPALDGDSIVFTFRFITDE